MSDRGGDRHHIQPVSVRLPADLLAWVNREAQATGQARHAILLGAILAHRERVEESRRFGAYKRGMANVIAAWERASTGVGLGARVVAQVDGEPAPRVTHWPPPHAYARPDHFVMIPKADAPLVPGSLLDEHLRAIRDLGPREFLWIAPPAGEVQP